MQFSHVITGAAYKMRNMTAAHLARHCKEFLTPPESPMLYNALQHRQSLSQQHAALLSRCVISAVCRRGPAAVSDQDEA